MECKNMKILQIENMTKSYGDKVLFDDISFSVGEKQRVGLVGVNGTGKSTLLKIIAGYDTSDSGNVSKPKDYSIAYLAQDPDLTANTTVLEEVFFGDSPLMKLFRSYETALKTLEEHPDDSKKQEHLFNLQQQMDAMNAWDANTQAKTILSKLGIVHIQKKVSDLSGGQKKRVAMAKSFIQAADLLIVDEPTNHLDHETIEWLEGYLANYQGSVMLITHDRYFLDRVTNRIFELDQGNLFSYEGNYSTFIEAKAEREASEEATYNKNRNILRKELAWIRRGAKARTTKQKARIQRFEELDANTTKAVKESLDMAIGGSRLGKKVFEIDHINKSYEGKTIIRDFSTLIKPMDRIGIVGKNGSGKTTLLNILAQNEAVDSGDIEVGTTVKIGYYTQENEQMDQTLRVIDYIKETAQVIRAIDGSTITASQMLERFLFSPKMQFTQISRLSGGERRRLYLLKVLMEEPNVLLLDEPTNDLDTETLTILEDYIDQFPGVVITVSHDRYFLDKSVDQLFIFEEEGQIRSFYGAYSDYFEEKVKQKQETKEEAKIVQPNKEKKKKKLSYHEQKEWDVIEEKIAEVEEKIEQLKLEVEKAGSDYGKVQDLFKEQEKLNDTLEKYMERWEELSLLVEELETN